MKETAYNHILKTAERLFNRFGFSKTAMSDIARDAKVSRATIFNNFGNKEGVLQAVLDNRRQELKAEIARCFQRTHSVSGRIRALLVERVKMLSAMKFITEDAIAVDNAAVSGFFNDMNTFFLDKIREVLGRSNRGKDEINGLIKTILHMTKGIEQGISEHADSFSIKQVEKDVDFFLKLAVPEEQDMEN